MKKTIAAIFAFLCIAGASAVWSKPSADDNTLITMSASAADAAVTEGKNASQYTYPYADTSVYTHKLEKVSIKITDAAGNTTDCSDWQDIDGNTYSLYKLTVSTSDVPDFVPPEPEYRIGITKANSSILSLTLAGEIPDEVAARIDEMGLEVTGTTATVIAPSAFTGSPSYLKEVDLTGIVYIGSKAFQNCSYVTEMTIPDSVRFVGDSAFSGSGLKSLHVENDMPVIPNSLCASTALTNITFAHPEFIREIGSSAFKSTPIDEPIFNSWGTADGYEDLTVGASAYEGCTAMTEIMMSDNVLYVEKSAFKGDTKVTKVSFGVNTLYADQQSFSGCSSLSDLTFNSVLNSLGGSAFSNCTSLVSVIDLPESLGDWEPEDKSQGMGFGDGVFQGCTALETVRLPESLTRVPKATFKGCKSLRTVYESGKIVKIKAEAFANCSNLLQVVYNNAQIVEDSAFSGCSSVQEITLPLVDTIGKSAFKGCSSLRLFEVGDCKTVGSNAMEGCTGIKHITLMSDEYGAYVFKGCTGAETITMNGSAIEPYKAYGLFSGCSSLTTLDADVSNIEVIPKETFAKCTALEQVNFPSLRIIEASAFSDCTSLKAINAGSIEAEDYGQKCFYNCTSLNSEVNGTISTIGANAFEKSAITKINISGMVGGTVVINNNAFANCPNLVSATVLSERAAEFKMGNSIFSGCSALKSCSYDGVLITQNMFKDAIALEEVASGAKTIQKSAFEGCSSLKMVKDKTDLSSSIVAETIESAAFKGCTKLSVLPANSSTVFSGIQNFMNCSSLTSANVGALTTSMFAGCSSLKNVNINSVSAIPDTAFQNCTSLEDIDLEYIISIGKSSFANSGLKSVFIDMAQTIGQNAFAGSNSLTSVDVSANTIGVSAFSNCLFLEDAVVFANTIGNNAFSGCSSLRNLSLQSGGAHILTEIGSGAFDNCPVLYEAVVPASPAINSKAFGFLNGKVNPEFLLVGEAGSSVQTYADKNKVAFADVATFDLADRQSGRNNAGDVDGNSFISMTDAVKLQSWLVKKQTPGVVPSNMDVNGDGRVDAFDLIVLRSKIKGVT